MRRWDVRCEHFLLEKPVNHGGRMENAVALFNDTATRFFFDEEC